MTGRQKKLERNLLGVFHHEPHAVDTQHIPYFVGIRYGGDGAVEHRSPGKLGGDQHRAFDVHVRVDESRQQVRGLRLRQFVHRYDFAARHTDPARKNTPVQDVDHVGRNFQRF